jgi:hypothetical protein
MSPLRQDARECSPSTQKALVYDKAPKFIFKRMHSNGFGKKSAEFMIEWAKLHADTDKEEENYIIRIGLADDAEPKEKLDEYYKMIKEKTKTKEKFSFHAKPSILSKRDTLALKTDGFTATNRLTLANGKNFVLWFNQSNEGISVDASIRAKVDVLRKVLEGAKKKAIVDMTKQGYESSILVEDAFKNFSTDYLRKLNLTTLNINNPNKTAEDIRNEMDAVRATFKNEDVVAIYSSALTSLQNLVREGVNLEQIGRILNSYLNPQTISGGEMDWYGFAEGNPNSFEFAQKVQELKSIRDAFKKDLENLAEFERVVDYDITNISEVKASFEKQDANVVVITLANLKQPKEVGLYAQIRKFARENNLKIIVWICVLLNFHFLPES